MVGVSKRYEADSLCEITYTVYLCLLYIRDLAKVKNGIWKMLIISTQKMPKMTFVRSLFFYHMFVSMFANRIYYPSVQNPSLHRTPEHFLNISRAVMFFIFVTICVALYFSTNCIKKCT